MKKQFTVFMIAVFCAVFAVGCGAAAQGPGTGLETASQTELPADRGTAETEKNGDDAAGNDPYEVRIVDENGDPVDGVIINVCTDEKCTPVTVQDGGTAWGGEAYPYVIHVLKVPDGYTFDLKQEFVMDADGETLVITVPHA